MKLFYWFCGVVNVKHAKLYFWFGVLRILYNDNPLYRGVYLAR